MKVEDIAASLSEAQRQAVEKLCALGGNPYGWSATEVGISSKTLNQLREKGLAISGRVYGGPVAWLATPLGEAVQSHLLNERGE